MRSRLAMTRPSFGGHCNKTALESRLTSASAVRCDGRFGALDRLDQHAPGLLGIAPAADAHPFLRLEVLIMGEEMLDLLENDGRQVLPFPDIRIIRKGRVHRYADDLL